LARQLHQLARALYERGRFNEALSYAQRALDIRERLLSPSDPELSQSCNTLGLIHRMLGHYREAEVLYLRALDIDKKNGGDMSTSYASVASNLGGLYRAMGLYDRAEIYTLIATEIRKKVLGEKHPDYALSLNNLALLYKDGGVYGRAEELYRQALAILSDRPRDAVYATTINNLASLYAQTGEYGKAEPLMLSALEITKGFGEDHPDYARSLNNLGALYESVGQYEKAEAQYKESLRITRVLGEDHPAYVLGLNNLGALYMLMAQYAKAERHFNEAANIRERLGPDHPDFAQSLNNLAVLYIQTGRYDDAEPPLRLALEIDKKSYGEESHHYATGLANLALVYSHMGWADRAEPLWLKAAELTKKIFGDNHPRYATITQNLAVSYLMLNRTRDAMQTWHLSLEAEQHNLRSVFSFSSEAGMRAYLSTMENSLGGLVSVATTQGERYPELVANSMEWLLRRKGIILDTTVRFRQAQWLARSEPAMSQKLLHLNSLRQQMSNLPLNRPRGMSDAELKQKLGSLAEESGQIEAELNRRLSEQQPQGQLPQKQVALDDVRGKLGPRAALIDFLRTEVYDFKATGKQRHWKPAHYFAFILRGDGKAPPRMVDLGEAADIDAAISAVRGSIADFGRRWVADRSGSIREEEEEKSYKEEVRPLHDLLFARLRKELGDVKRVYLSPDGQLNLLPFEALVDASDKYLVESYQFAYLSSGRDLLRTTRGEGKGAVIFADPDYDMKPAARAEKAKTLLAESDAQSAGRPDGRAMATTPAPRPWASNTPPPKVQQSSRQGRGGSWDRLKESPVEAALIERELGVAGYVPIRTYLGERALEEVFKQVRSPKVLHISTHGFFPEENDEGAAAEGQLDLSTGSIAFVGKQLLQRSATPLLQSGLVLAGANTIGQKPAEGGAVDDGWVTAEEIAMMSLQGTDLVVLSACGSGLGAVSSGEGVYGLRRAFQSAGARSIISTLSVVPDTESRDLMRRFYEGLKSRKGKLDALHAAQLQLIGERRRKEKAAHPFFWASFVLSGSPD
jgi:CHAT domain-containing protein/tetratricopeptide (TPR) repeat protein